MSRADDGRSRPPRLAGTRSGSAVSGRRTSAFVHGTRGGQTDASDDGGLPRRTLGAENERGRRTGTRRGSRSVWTRSGRMLGEHPFRRPARRGARRAPYRTALSLTRKSRAHTTPPSITRTTHPGIDSGLEQHDEAKRLTRNSGAILRARRPMSPPIEEGEDRSHTTGLHENPWSFKPCVSPESSVFPAKSESLRPLGRPGEIVSWDGVLMWDRLCISLDSSQVTSIIVYGNQHEPLIDRWMVAKMGPRRPAHGFL
jgi:hypothetical protein